MDEPALPLLIVLLTGVGLVVLAPKLRVPYPILVLFGGAALGIVPGMPDVVVSPDVVLLVLLPPLLYSAAFFFPLGSLKRNARPIGLLAIVVTGLTMGAVAVAAHVAFGISWPVAFVLGAILSPTDPTAVEAIASRLHVPRELVAVLQGESLINDAMALTLYASALMLVVEGQLSAGHVLGQFLGGVAGGVAIGLVFGWLVVNVRARVDSAPEELALSIGSAYVAYLAADAVHASGVLAAVVIGFYHGRRQHQWISAGTRLHTFSFWSMLTFLINAVLFVLIGLQLPQVVGALDERSLGTLIGGTLLVTAVIVAVRVAWVGSTTSALRLVERRGTPKGALSNRFAIVVGLIGMRGGVSLAAVLALPEKVADGGAFPERDLLIFVTFGVIVLTLAGEGLAMPTLLRRLGLEGDETVEREETEARLEVARAAHDRLGELRDEPWVRDETAERLAELYAFREQRYAARMDGNGREHHEERSQDFQRLRRELLAAERRTLAAMRDEGRIDGDVAGRVEYDLDLEENRLEPEV